MRTLAFLLLAGVVFAGGGPQNVVVLLNDTSADSEQVAKYYVEKRHIPSANVLHLRCPSDHTIDLATYQATIERPFRRFLRERGIADQIDFLVLCQGMPLRVNIGGEAGGIIAIAAQMELMDTPLAGEPQEQHTTHGNPYNWKGAFHHANEYGGSHLYLVTHLAANNAADVKKMIDSSVASDGTAPKGDYWFQDADGNAKQRNVEYDGAITFLHQQGFTADHVKSGVDVLVGRKDVMGYMSGGCYSQLSKDGIHKNEYRPGSIVDMLESFGAVPENFQNGATQFPVTWFLDLGVAGIHGAVAEPYSDVFPSVRLFERYIQGYNLAETFYGTLPFVHWMNLVDGDPLCQPYAQRPEVVAGAPTGDASGSVVIHAKCSAKDAKVARVELFVDGRKVAKADGAEVDLPWDTTKFSNGPHELIVAATDSTPVETQGQAILAATVDNPALRVIATTPADGAANVPLLGPFVVHLNRAVSKAEGIAFVDDAGAAVPAKAEVAEDGLSVTVVPSAPLKGGRKYKGTVQAGWKPTQGQPLPDAVSWGFTTTAKAFTLGGPAEVRAGEPFDLKVSAQDDEGKPIAAYAGFLNVTSSDPAAQTLKVGQTFGDHDSITVSCTLRTLGKTTLTVIDTESGAKGEATVEVSPGPVRSLTIAAPQGGIPRGTPVPIVVSAMDGAGNPVPTFTGKVTLTADVQTVTLPPAHAFEAFERGRHTFTRVVFQAAGDVTLTATDAGGATGTQKLTVSDGGIRSWLWIGPLTMGKAPLIDPDQLGNEAKVAPVAGQAVKTKRWSPFLTGGDGVDLSSFVSKETGAVYAVVNIESPKDQDAQLWFGSQNVARVFWNGVLFHRVDKKREHKAFEDHVPMLRLGKGPNRLIVKLLEEGGGVRFSAKVCDDQGKSLGDLTYSTVPPGAPPRMTLAGCIRVKGQVVPNVPVALAGPEKLVATSGPDGRFDFPGLAPGAWTLKPSLPKVTFDPDTLKVDLSDQDVLDAVFELGDTVPPTARLTAPKSGTKVAGMTQLAAEASDNEGILRVRFLVDGEPVGQPVTKEPFAITIDANSFPAGEHQVSAEAEDLAGNRFATKAQPMTVVVDKTPPQVQIVSPNGEEGVKAKIDLVARVADDVAVASVQWYIDDKAIGALQTAAPWVVPYTPDRKAGKGWHVVKAVVKDSSGNTGEAQVKFEVK